MQYCYLKLWILLLLPVPPTTGHFFCIGSIPSFFLELFLHWSPVACWAPTYPGSSFLSILSFCLFKARILKWFADPDVGRDWGQNEKGTTKDEMAGWHHWLDGHASEQALGVGDGQGSLACCSLWGRRVGQDWATELNFIVHHVTDEQQGG